jgi:hypothetical protein
MSLSSLPTPVLCIIHQLVFQAGGLRSALSLEAASKELCTLLRANTHLPGSEVTLARWPATDRWIAAFWTFVAAHGHRLDRVKLEEGPCWPSASSRLPPLSVQKGVSSARSVTVLECSSVSTLVVLAGLPNLHHLSCSITAESSRALHALEGLTTLQSLTVGGRQSTSSLQSLPRLTGLTRLELCHLPRLTALERHPCHAANLQALTLDGLSAVTTLAPISSLTRLTSLTLRNFSNWNTVEGLNGLAPLGCLQSLQHLSMEKLRATHGSYDLSPLTSLRSLHTLLVTSCSINNLWPIAPLGCTLQELHLTPGGHDIHEVAAIGALPSLRVLWLHWTGGNLTNMGALSPLTNLEALHIGAYGQLSILETSSDLTASLQRMQYDYAHGISSLAPLSVLSSLHTLSLQYLGRVSDLGPIGHLPALRQLRLHAGQGVCSLQPLGSLGCLTGLSLSCLPDVSSLQPLSQLSSLQRLCLYEMDAVRSLEPLSALTGLRGLALHSLRSWETPPYDNSHLAPLDSLTCLQTLTIWRCRCRDGVWRATPARPAVIFPGGCITDHVHCSCGHLRATLLAGVLRGLQFNAFRSEQR